MPPSTVKTIENLIHYQYAKIIASSAGIKGDYSFIMSTMKKLSSGAMQMSGFSREGKKQASNQCSYCPATENLTWDHLVSRKKGGSDCQNNGVWACKSCNSSKGAKGVYEWYGIDKKDEIPRLIEGKYLKLLYDIHKLKGTLQSSDLNGDGCLNVLDLDVI